MRDPHHKLFLSRAIHWRTDQFSGLRVGLRVGRNWPPTQAASPGPIVRLNQNPDRLF